MKNKIKKTIHCSTPAEKKKLYNHQSLQKSDGSAEESINSCLKRKQKNLPTHEDKGKISQKQKRNVH